jgi:hypothetical protein
MPFDVDQQRDRCLKVAEERLVEGKSVVVGEWSWSLLG